VQLGSACHEGDVVGCRINFSSAVNFGGSQGPPVSATWSRNGTEIGTVKFDDNHSGRFSQEVRLPKLVNFTNPRNLTLQVSEIGQVAKTLQVPEICEVANVLVDWIGRGRLYKTDT